MTGPRGGAYRRGMTAARGRAPAPLEDRTYPLTALAGARPVAPDWFARALAAPHTDGRVDVGGADIAWRRWGEAGKPGLVFVHGGVAHLGWWDFIAPFFADRFTPMALSLSGMGDSGWREAYAFSGYPDEVVAAARAAGLYAAERKPVVVGHSMGGFVTLATAARHGDALAGAVILDSPVRADAERPRADPRRRGGKVYPDETAALARFRLLPDQDCENLFLLDHIARAALKPAPDGAGVTWKHDPNLWPKIDFDLGRPGGLIAQRACPMALLRGGLSALVGEDLWAEMGALFGPQTPQATIPEAHHHVMLDQPLALVAALGALLSVWPGRKKIAGRVAGGR